MAVEVTVEPATPAHADELAPVLRAPDLAEGLAAGFKDAADLLHSSLRLSSVSWAVRFNGEIAALFGIRFTGQTILGRSSTGNCWALTGEVCSRFPVTFVRVARDCLDWLLSQCPRMENWVDCRYTGALRWLKSKRMGFTLGPIGHPGASDFPFQHVSIGGV